MNNVLVKENVEADEKLINNMYDEIANCTFVNDVKQNFYKKRFLIRVAFLFCYCLIYSRNEFCKC